MPSLVAAPWNIAATSVMPASAQVLPPVIVTDGEGVPNGLSVARSLGRRGVKVYAICPPGGAMRYSRYCTWLPESATGSTTSAWADYLLGPQSRWLEGAILLTANDAGLQLLTGHRAELQKRYRLDDSNVPAQLCMLDKLATYQAARAAGVPTPKFWLAQTRDQVLSYRDELVYPLLVKPLLSHVYRSHFGTKFVRATNFDEVMAGYLQAESVNIPVMLVEMLPGGDDLLCSYFTYLDKEGNALFDFTKRVIRRYPITSGPGCCHVTDWIPELKEPALKLFRHVGLRGVANVEFKRDPRDGIHKLIECNARFVGSNGLVVDAGFDIPWFVYNRILGRPLPTMGPLIKGKRLWFPIEDYYAYRQLRRGGKLTFWQWLRSVAHPTTLPFFRWSDPRPTLMQETSRIAEAIGRRVRRWFGNKGG